MRTLGEEYKYVGVGFIAQQTYKETCKRKK